MTLLFKIKTILNSIITPYWMISSVLLVIGLDQLVKYKIRHLGGFYVCNKGISLGLLIHPVIFWFIAVFLLFSVLFYVKWMIHKNILTIWPFLAIILLIGGGLSNIIDRFWLGCVVDFLSGYWTILPLFNPADIFVFLGSVFLVGFLLKKEVS